MTGMPVRGVSVLPVMSRSFVTGAVPVWNRGIGRSGVMLMRGLIITEDLIKSEPAYRWIHETVRKSL